MTFRAAILGLLVGLFIASITFYNDFVVKGTMLVASHLPIGVFGLLAIAVLVANPLLRLLGRAAPLTAGELAVATAIALAACPWPGSGFWRYAVTGPSMPAHWLSSSTSWQGQGLMSYVPGGSPLVAEGQVTDPQGAARRLLDEPGLAGALEEAETRMLRGIAEAPRAAPTARRELAAVLNRLIGAEEDVAAKREELTRALSPHVAPPPRGEGALVTGGRRDRETIEHLVTGHGTGELLSPENVPWAAWWPTLRLWAGSALLLGLASLCLSIIVHPQWSQRELLPYPIARLVNELGERSEGRGLPDVARSAGFWVALVTVLAIHSINGLRAWYPELPTVPLRYDLGGFRTMFPNGFRVPLSYGVFAPTVFFSVIGFAFFLPTAASLSMGLAPLAWVTFGGMLLANGIPIDYSKIEPTKANFLRFGAYLGMAAMIVYIGRRYYAHVVLGALGMRRGAGDATASAIWAARALVPLVLSAGVLLYTAGLEWWTVALLLFSIFLSWLVLTRIVCETGMIFVTNAFHVAVIVEGLVGFEALGPTGIILVGMTAWLLIADPRECAMPYLATALAAVDRSGAGVRAVAAKIAPLLAIMLVGSMLVAGFVTLCLQYEHGVTGMKNPYAMRDVPNMPFNRAALLSSEASSIGTLASSVAATGWDKLAFADPEDGVLWWLALGFGLVLATALARLRLPTFPLHPVLFLVWGTYASSHMGFSFLLGWAIKAAVTGTGGAGAYRTAKPIMIGLIVGELLAAVLWMVVGATYFEATGLAPVTYSIFPG